MDHGHERCGVSTSHAGNIPGRLVKLGDVPPIVEARYSIGSMSWKRPFRQPKFFCGMLSGAGVHVSSSHMVRMCYFCPTHIPSRVSRLIIVRALCSLLYPFPLFASIDEIDAGRGVDVGRKKKKREREKSSPPTQAMWPFLVLRAAATDLERLEEPRIAGGDDIVCIGWLLQAWNRQRKIRQTMLSTALTGPRRIF